MAIFLRGMNARETADLTELMANSGDRIDLSEIKGIKSTNTVPGELAINYFGSCTHCCFLWYSVAKCQGKGLGHTGGTLISWNLLTDLKPPLTMEDFISNIRQIRDIHCIPNRQSGSCR